MSISKNLVVTLTNDAEGISMTFKTVSGVSEGSVLISGDPGLYQIFEVEKALNECRDFLSLKNIKNASSLCNLTVGSSSCHSQSTETFSDYISGT